MRWNDTYMTNDRWLDLLDKISNFEQEERFTEEIEDIPNGKREIVIFKSPVGRIKLIRTTKPRVLDKKTIYSARSGSDMKVEYVYSEDEMVDNLEILKFDTIEDDWVKASINL